MNSYTVVFAPEAEAQLTELYFYIAERASVELITAQQGHLTVVSKLHSFFCVDFGHY